MNAPNIAIFQLSVLEEAVITAVERASTIGLPLVKHVSIVPIKWAKSLSKLIEV